MEQDSHNDTLVPQGQTKEKLRGVRTNNGCDEPFPRNLILTRYSCVLFLLRLRKWHESTLEGSPKLDTALMKKVSDDDTNMKSKTYITLSLPD